VGRFLRSDTFPYLVKGEWWPRRTPERVRNDRRSTRLQERVFRFGERPSGRRSTSASWTLLAWAALRDPVLDVAEDIPAGAADLHGTGDGVGSRKSLDGAATKGGAAGEFVCVDQPEFAAECLGYAARHGVVMCPAVDRLSVTAT
jgi:hypothetical protein